MTVESIVFENANLDNSSQHQQFQPENTGLDDSQSGDSKGLIEDLRSVADLFSADRGPLVPNIESVRDKELNANELHTVNGDQTKPDLLSERLAGDGALNDSSGQTTDMISQLGKTAMKHSMSSAIYSSVSSLLKDAKSIIQQP